MSDFAEVMAANPPRLVVQYGKDVDGQETFNWGVVGKGVPIVSLIGFVARVQHNLILGVLEQECPQPALVIAYVDGNFVCYTNPEIPLDSLLGTLELVKAVLVEAHITQSTQQQARNGIVGPDGQPYKRF